MLLYKSPRLLVLTILTIVTAGLSAYRLLPRREDPEIVARFATIVTRLPGADAERVEALVTKKIEDRLREISEIEHIGATSRTGVSVIAIEIDDHIEHPGPVMTKVRDKLDDVLPELPADASRPDLDDTDTDAYSLIAAVVWEQPGEAQYGILSRFADDLEDRLRGLPGAFKVEQFGAQQEEIVVEIDPLALDRTGLTAADVSRAVQHTDAKVRAGQLRTRSRNLLIEVEGGLDTLDQLGKLPLRVDASAHTLQLGDIATIKKGVMDPARSRSWIDGKPGIAIAMRMAGDQRIDLWAERAHEVIDGFASELPRGLAVDIVFDQSRYVVVRLADLTRNFLLGALAVAVVVFVMMGWRAALLVGASIPLTSLMVLSGLYAMAIPLHQMSVTGLIIALGLLIDNGIVIVDEVRGRQRDGLSAGEAIAESAKQLAVPLLGSTLTTALAFMPLALLPGGAGDFVGSIAISVILALGSSLFLAMTVIPALTGLFGGKIDERSGWLQHGVTNERLAAAYGNSLSAAFRRPVVGLGLAIALPVFGFVQASTLEEQFFPPADRDQLQVQVELPAHVSLAETERRALAVRDALLQHPRVTHVHWFVGASAPRFYYNLLGGQDDAAFFAQALVQLDGSERVTELIQRTQREMDRAFPDARVLVRQLEQGPPFDAPVELRIYGPDLDQLDRIGEDVRSVLAGVPGVTHTRTSLDSARPKLSLELDDEATRLAGLDNVGVAERLETSLEGRVGSSILEGTEEVPIRVRLCDASREAVDEIASTSLQSIGGTGSLPLTALGRLALLPARSKITRRDGSRVNTVQGFVEAGILPATVLSELQKRVAATGESLPEGYRIEVGGESQQRDQAVGNLMASVLLLTILMVATLVLSFNSFRMAAIIASVALLSAGLSLAALVMFGQVFGFMAIIGTMGLIGVAINDSIVVLAALREDPDARAGDIAAMRRVVERSTRHVLATSITTVAGFLPLILAGGGFWPPLAIAIAGGVAGSTLLAVYFVPSLYKLVICRAGAA